MPSLPIGDVTYRRSGKNADRSRSSEDDTPRRATLARASNAGRNGDFDAECSIEEARTAKNVGSGRGLWRIMLRL